jgi:hypothetical protein
MSHPPVSTFLNFFPKPRLLLKSADLQTRQIIDENFDSDKTLAFLPRFYS